jgi:hypothetical protein
MRQLRIPRWLDLKVMSPFVLVPILITVLGMMIFPFVQSSDPAEAGAVMLASPALIDGQRAFGYLKKICNLGPRVAGSEANTRQRQLVAEHFRKLGAKVREQPFQSEHPLTGERVNMANLIGSWHPDREQRVVIGAHYDTRPHPDQEDDPERQQLPFLGANDGASGVAVLMEIAHHLDKLETPWGVDLVLFDGEELVYGDNPRRGQYFLGSWHFSQSYTAEIDRGRSKMRYVAGVVLDMVGGRDLKIPREPNSLRLAPEQVREVWAVARQIGARSFLNEVGREVLDDHLALNDAGIPTIDLIDFAYPFWHKADDLPENCSAESLEQVGRVVTAWLALPRRRARR